MNSAVVLGRGQYRNAVASGRAVRRTLMLLDGQRDPTLPRYGTDLVQVRPLVKGKN